MENNLVCVLSKWMWKAQHCVLGDSIFNVKYKIILFQAICRKTYVEQSMTSGLSWFAGVLT